MRSTRVINSPLLHMHVARVPTNPLSATRLQLVRARKTAKASSRSPTASILAKSQTHRSLVEKAAGWWQTTIGKLEEGHRYPYSKQQICRSNTTPSARQHTSDGGTHKCRWTGACASLKRERKDGGSERENRPQQRWTAGTRTGRRRTEGNVRENSRDLTTTMVGVERHRQHRAAQCHSPTVGESTKTA